MIMSWGKCKREFVRKITPDVEMIESLKEKSTRRSERARQGTDTDFIVEDYYEAINELLIAYLLKNGYRSKNHQCLISFFHKENPDYEPEAQLIQQMSFFRNRLNYYGEDIPSQFYEKNKDEFERIITLLLKMIEE